MAGPIRVSPTEPNPTHHVSLRDRDGKKLGLILCDFEGKPMVGPSTFTKNPVETTAQKQTSGNSSYADFEYPYSPIVQDDFSGGRGSLDFERDSTKYYDSYRTKSGRANKAFLGPQEQWTSGLRNQEQNVPSIANGGVKWHPLTGDARHVYKRFQASASYTVALAWPLVRIKGKPANLTIAIHADSAGSVGSSITSVSVPYTRMADTLSEWLNETVSGALTSGTFYWIVINASANDNDDSHWKIGVREAAGTTYYSDVFDSTPIAATFDLYYRLTIANVEQTCIPFEYKELQYFVISGTSGAPRIHMTGDRGAADSNAGQLNKLIDATKSWAVNSHVGKIAMIIDGPGRNEPIRWRVVASNTATELVFSTPWTIEHTTSTEYVILGLGVGFDEITGHGLTAPVTSVLVSPTNVIYFCMGESTTVRRMREYNNAGVWTREYADETATTKATFMVYKPIEKRIVIGNNNDASGNVSVSYSSNAGGAPAWGTALTWDTAIPVDSRYKRINGLIIHPDDQANEVTWVFKEDLPFYINTSGVVKEVNLPEMLKVRSANNGVTLLRHGVYLYFSMQNGLERYYNGQFDDVGPNLGEGLPANRRGPIVGAVGYPGKFFVAIDAGSSGYSSIMDSDGWHERYRAPKGQRIRAMGFQTIPGSTLDRLWIFQGNDLIWLPFPSETLNELEDSAYPYTHECAITLSRMHAGMFDVQKLVKKIKLQTDQLEVNETTGEEVCWFELDYRLNEETEWGSFDDLFTTSPTQEIDLTQQYGLAGKREQVRVRGYTTDNTKTPILLAIILNAVLRTDVKYMYPLQFRLMDREPLGVRGTAMQQEEDTTTAEEKRTTLENWADASTDSMLLMESISPLFNNKMVFLNPPTTRQILFKGQDDNEFKRDVFICTASLQEA